MNESAMYLVWYLLIVALILSVPSEAQELRTQAAGGAIEPSRQTQRRTHQPAGLFADLMDTRLFRLATAGPTPFLEPQSRRVRVDLLRLAAVRDEVRNQRQAHLPLNLFPDATFEAIIERTTETRSGYTLSGRLAGHPLSSVTIVVNGTVVAGMVNSVEGTWLIRSRGAGVVEIRKSEGEFRCGVGSRNASGLAPALPTPLGKVSVNQDSGDEIDVLVLFTAAARQREGNYDDMRAWIDLLVASTNEAYRLGGAVLRIKLAAAVQVDYTESSDHFGNRVDHDNLKGENDGHMDEIHDLRDSYAADLVILLIDHPQWVTGGLADSFLDPVQVSSDFAFAVVESEDRPATFAHELGHLMGLKHDRYTRYYYENRSEINSPFPYAHGYVNQRAFDNGADEKSRWHTIMAYPNQLTAAGFVFTESFELMRFSNPTQFHHGDPMGVPGDEASDAVDGPSDAVRTLNNTRSIVANYRQHADACRFTLSETKRTVDQAGTQFAVNVEGTGRCSYRAWSTDDFLTLSKESGSGGDEMIVRVAPNAGRARTGYVIVAGETLIIDQSGAGSFLSVCDRTPAVAGKLAALTNRSSCKDVTEHDLLRVGVLDLKEQGITELTPGDFDGLWNLVELDLSDNSIPDLPDGVFDDLISLKRLVLWGNSLRRLSATMFGALSGLESLGLSQNNLGRVPEGIFDGLTNLRSLALIQCELTDLPDDLFANLPRLQDLWLQGNHFQEIPGALRTKGTGLDSVFALGFSQNPLTTLPANAFAGLPELDQLHLTHMPLSSISKDAFSGLTKLSRLYLYDNRIEDLSGVVFPGEEIVQLNLSNNRISSLPADLFRGFTSRACNGTASPLILNLAGNPGSSFSLAVELVREDADNAAASPARLVARVVEGAPWPLTVDLTLDGDGSLSARQVVIPNGSVQSEPIEVTADQPVTVRVSGVTELPPSYQGVKTVPGQPLRLFAPAPTPDFDGDGTVDLADFLLFVGAFGLSRGDEDYNARYDLDGNGSIDLGDFLIFVEAFGQ